MAALHATSSLTVLARFASAANEPLVSPAQHALHIHTSSTSRSASSVILDLPLLRLLAIQVRSQAGLLAEPVLTLLCDCDITVTSGAHLLGFLVGNRAAHLCVSCDQRRRLTSKNRSCAATLTLSPASPLESCAP